MTKSQMVVRLASHPDEFQTHYSLPLSRMRLFCWTTYFQGYLKCNCANAAAMRTSRRITHRDTQRAHTAVSNQFSSFYRDGTFSDCSDVWKNVTECFRISRLSSDDATVRFVSRTVVILSLAPNPLLLLCSLN